jgi:hypothetical protein
LRFKLREVKSNSNYLLIPSNIQQFLFDFQNSKFIECSSTLKKTPQDEVKNRIFLQALKYVTAKLENMRKTYWLSSGTLLGRIIIFYSNNKNLTHTLLKRMVQRLWFYSLYSGH